MDTQTTSAVKKALDTAKNLVVIGHKNPDGDAIGSSLGLAGFLRKKDFEVTVVMPNEFPEFLKWMPGCDDLLIYEKQAQEVQKTLDAADVIFTLDFNALNRSGDLSPLLEASEAKFIMIDHHQQPDAYAVATYSDASMSSTAQMVFHFMEALDGIPLLDRDIATNLYTGIMTDTGSFRFSATTATTHRVIAQLLEHGAVPNVIHENIYDTASQNRMKLLGVALNNLTVLPEYRTAYITLSQEELDAHDFRKGDTEGFVNYALAINNIVFAVIFIENRQENIVKISLRSKGPFSVNQFSRNHFNGGGHNNAAGGRRLKSLDETVREFISILPQYQKALIDA